jgi:Domain of unknown function (DUF4340)
MGTKKLLIAAGLLAALSGVLWWSNKHPDWGKAKTPETETPTLVNVPDVSLDGVDIQKKDGSKVSLEHKGKWSITAPTAFPADQDAAGSIASALAPANGDSVVEEKPGDVGKYGLTNTSLTVTIHEKGGKSHQLLFGDDIPAGSMVYVRVAGNPKVYAAASSLKTSFDKSVNDLRDKRLLTFDQNQLTRVDLMSGKTDIEFGKNGQSEWTIVQPQPYRADNFQVEDLVRKLSEAKMDLNVPAADAEKAQHGYASGKLVATAKLTDSTGTQTFEVHKSGDDYFAKSSAVNGTYKLTAELGKLLEKPLDEFRNKKIFDFGFSDPTKVEIQGKTFTRSGSDWKSDGKIVDSASVQAVIDKLRDLSAAKFVTGGFTTAAASITVVSNDGKRTEKAEFSKDADGYVVRRGSEPGLYQMNAKSLDDILEAGNKVKPAAGKK